MAHTPGPWEADVNECAKVRDSQGALLASCNHLEIYGRRDSDTVAANARLIAAAPELLQACIRAERKLRAYLGVCSGDKELRDTVLPMCEAAIAKATGGA